MKKTGDCNYCGHLLCKVGEDTACGICDELDEEGISVWCPKGCLGVWQEKRERYNFTYYCRSCRKLTCLPANSLVYCGHCYEPDMVPISENVLVAWEEVPA